MGDVATAIVVGIQVPDLIDQGHLVDVDVYAPGRSLDARQHAQSAWDAYPAGKRGVVFAPDRRYSAETVAGLRARGIRSEHLDGAMRSPWRAEVLRRLAAGELDVVSNVGLLAEGWDLPALEVAVVARSCHSAALWLQICGRVMRPHPGKTKGTIIDLVGAVHRHGLPSMRREFSLDGDGVSSPSDRMALQQCSSCGAVWVRNGTPHCPQCGAGQSLRERDPIAFAGERLERITAAQQANAAKGEEYMMGLLKQFMAVARERGYNPGWARYQVAQKTGLKPSWAQVNACR
jgi:superfamily II DNA or RNA helicase